MTKLFQQVDRFQREIEDEILTNYASVRPKPNSELNILLEMPPDERVVKTDFSLPEFTALEQSILENSSEPVEQSLEPAETSSQVRTEQPSVEPIVTEETITKQLDQSITEQAITTVHTELTVTEHSVTADVSNNVVEEDVSSGRRL
jgi:hypothetical protein